MEQGPSTDCGRAKVNCTPARMRAVSLQVCCGLAWAGRLRTALPGLLGADRDCSAQHG